MTKDIYDIDYETRSAADLRKYGAARYAEDDTTKILMFAISKNASEPIIWDIYDSQLENHEALEMLNEAIDTGSRIYAHNYQFEHFISKYNLKRQLGIDPPDITQWRCTAAMARRAAIPFSLEKCAEFLKLDVQKDKIGGALIQLFSIPKKGEFIEGDAESTHTIGGKSLSAVDAWDLFTRYCRQDVRTQIAIRLALPKFDFDLPKQVNVLASFQSDGFMNDRGVPVNVGALTTTDKLVKEYQERVGDEFRELTGYNFTQKAKVKAWLQDGGFPADNLQAATVAHVLKKQTHLMDEDSVKALNLLKLLSFAAIAKIPTMINAANKDGRVRGTVMWSGALRTHRWTGRIIQPQNMRRPTIDDTDAAYEMLQDPTTTAEDLEMFWGSPLEVVASCIRHFIHDQEHELFDVDYSNIEARILSWLAGDKEKLEKFAAGVDLYKEAAEMVFGTPALEVSKAERFVGKVAELGLGYQAAWMAFSNMLTMFGYESPADEVAKFSGDNAKVISGLNKIIQSRNEAKILDAVKNYPLLAITYEQPAELRYAHHAVIKKYVPEGKDYSVIKREHVALYLQHLLCKKVVKLYRESNPKVCALWKEFDAAAKNAVKNKGEIFGCADDKVHFKVDDVGFEALFMCLPSGHCLVYPKPEIKSKKQSVVKNGQKREWVAEYVTYEGQLPNSVHFGRVASYGGKWVENCVSGEAEVLTPFGWQRLDSITNEDVWDGEAFVCHKGLKASGTKETTCVDGVWMTPDHQVLLHKSWTPAINCLPSEASKHYEETYRHNQPNLRETNCGVGRGEENNPSVQAFTGGDRLGGTVKSTRCFTKVYDLVDCGDNHRFVVRKGKGFAPFIVHNCCQAIGGDFLSHGLIAADKAGFETFAVIHDQALAPVKDGLTLEGYTDALCTLPAWAKGFPLAGDGGVVPYYTKD